VEGLPGETMNNVRDHIRIGPMLSLGTYPLCNRSVARASRPSPKSKRLRSQRRTAGFRYCGDVIGAVVQQFTEATSKFYTYRLSEASGDMPILIRRHAYPRRNPTCLRMPGFGYLEFWGTWYMYITPSLWILRYFLPAYCFTTETSTLLPRLRILS
jgi:hypothetical protein